MAVKIPSSHMAPLRHLALMDAPVRRELVAALRSSKPLLDPGELASDIAKKCLMEPVAASTIVRMLLSMYRRPSSPASEFAAEVCESLKDQLAPDESSKVNWAVLSADLRALLECENTLGITAKAQEVQTDHSAVFCDARILSDIRPVFGSEADSPPVAAAVVHTLRISHHSDGTHKDFFVALDAQDLRTLRSAIDRAMKKELTLKALLDKMGLHFLETERN